MNIDSRSNSTTISIYLPNRRIISTMSCACSKSNSYWTISKMNSIYLPSSISTLSSACPKSNSHRTISMMNSVCLLRKETMMSFICIQSTNYWTDGMTSSIYLPRSNTQNATHVLFLVPQILTKHQVDLLNVVVRIFRINLSLLNRHPLVHLTPQIKCLHSRMKLRISNIEWPLHIRRLSIA